MSSTLANAPAASSYMLLIEPLPPFFVSKRKVRFQPLPAGAAPDDFLSGILRELGRGLTEARRAQLEGQRAHLNAHIRDAVTKEFAPLRRIEQLRNKATVKLTLGPGAPGAMDVRASSRALRAIEEAVAHMASERDFWLPRRIYVDQGPNNNLEQLGT